MKSDELKTKLYEEYKESFEEEEIKFEELLPSIQSDDIKVEYLIEHCDKCKKVYYKDILYSLQSEEAYINVKNRHYNYSVTAINMYDRLLKQDIRDLKINDIKRVPGRQAV